MAQPEWVQVVNLGDVNPIEYGGLFVYRDTTGVYCEEMENLESPDDDSSEQVWRVYRTPIDRCKYVNGILSHENCDQDHPEWFANDLDNVARSYGRETEDVIRDLCSDDPAVRAMAYESIAHYHGWDNFDETPLELTKEEVRARYPEYA